MHFKQIGFSLIELMVVVAIIGILATVAVPSYKNYIDKTNFATIQSAIEPVKQAISICVQQGRSPGECRPSDPQNKYMPQVRDLDGKYGSLTVNFAINPAGDNTGLLYVNIKNPNDASKKIEYTQRISADGTWAFEPNSSKSCIDIGWCQGS